MRDCVCRAERSDTGSHSCDPLSVRLQPIKYQQGRQRPKSKESRTSLVLRPCTDAAPVEAAEPQQVSGTRFHRYFLSSDVIVFFSFSTYSMFLALQTRKSESRRRELAFPLEGQGERGGSASTEVKSCTAVNNQGDRCKT